MSTREKIEKKIRILQEKKRNRARENFDKFVLYTYEDYSLQWFHAKVCEYLDKLSEREIKKLMIFMPPQHGKTELSSRRFPAYLLGKNPKEKIILGSYNKTKACEFVRDCNKIVKSRKYRELYPDTKVEGKDAEDMFEINGGDGFLKGAGMDSGVTGTTATCYIIDDPFKGRNTANSKTIRDRTWGTLQDDFKTRIDNNGIELMLFTRWHEDDIAGRILDKENEYYDEEEASEWTVLVFTALKEAASDYENAERIEEDKRAIDEALWEEKHSADKYKKRRRNNPIGFNSMDQQRPSPPEGNIIKKDWFPIIPASELPFNINLIAAELWIDGAFTKETENDASGLMSSYFNQADGKLYIFNASDVRKEMYEFLPHFKSYALANYYKPNTMVNIELKASGHSMKSMLSKVEFGGFNTRGINSKVVALGKYNRGENVSPFVEGGKVVLVAGPWVKAFVDQCGGFPNVKADDMFDLMCYAVHKYLIKQSSSGVDYQ